MGLFVQRVPNVAPVQSALQTAYLDAQRAPDEAASRAASEAPAVAERVASPAKVYKTERIVFAVAFFLLLLGIAIAAEALDWVADPAKIYDFAGLVLAVIIGWLGGESAS